MSKGSGSYRAKNKTSCNTVIRFVHDPYASVGPSRAGPISERVVNPVALFNTVEMGKKALTTVPSAFVHPINARLVPDEILESW